MSVTIQVVLTNGGLTMKRVLVSLFVLFATPVCAGQFMLYPIIAVPASKGQFTSYPITTDSTSYGIVIEDCVINDNISLPSFSVYRTPSSTVWEWGATFVLNRKYVKLYAGLRTGFLFIDRDDGANEFGHDVYGDVESRPGGTYYPAIINAGIMFAYDPIIIVLSHRLSYVQYDREWANVGSEGYEVAWAVIFGAGIRADF